jgi:ATP-grasp domain, R2K clade family 2
MFSKAYIHEYGNGRLEPEHRAVMEVLQERGMPYELFTYKRLARNQLLLSNQTFVVGDHPTILTALKRLGISIAYPSYPNCLQAYLHRRVWATTLKQLLGEAQMREMGPLFIKPQGKAKLFTGFVAESSADLLSLDGYAKDTAVDCATEVHWQSEYRVFVNQGKIVGVRHYGGDNGLLLDMEKVKKAIADLTESMTATVAYGIDFGVLDNGQTALVEWNDGFALGGYGLDKEIYTDLLLARWAEIVKGV